ncbi:hypothetical protein FDK21_18985, partial [Cohaesibacter sp. CAU 1516]
SDAQDARTNRINCLDSCHIPHDFRESYDSKYCERFLRVSSYIKKINIDKEGESTGLVTRFTIRKETSPAGYPVCLRWLSHADIIKIIANAYQLDGRPREVPERDEIASHIAPFREKAGQEVANGLRLEDVWDLEDYFKKYLPDAPLTAKLDAFWKAAGELCTRLSIEDLGDFFSILWGREPIITKLYRDMVTALGSLDFPKDAFVPLDAIDATNPDITSIITVAGLSGLSDGTSEQIEVRNRTGSAARLPRSTVAALTAEIWITIRDKPWDFFDHTDLLDFPGYRSRGLKAADFEDDDEPEGKTGIAKYLEQNPDKTLQTLMLRGKVEYLFQRYVEEQEITSMLLCAQPNNLDVDQLPQVVAKWITETHGPKPEDRIGKAELLFFVFTKFDLHFKRKTSDASFGLENRLEGAIDNPLIQSYGNSADSWVKNWTPGQPFNNCYLMRNPNILNGEIFDIEGDREAGVRSSEEAFLDELKSSFAGVPSAREHFKDPEQAFDEMMRLNDGGASFIARNLAPVCNPGIKEKQIRFRLKKLKQRLYERLSPYHVSSDMDARLEARLSVAQIVIDELYLCDSLARFGSLLRGFMLPTASLSDRLHEASFNQTTDGHKDSPTAAPAAPVAAAPRAIRSRPKLGSQRAAPDASPTQSAAASVSSTRKTRERLVAEAAIAAMIDNLFERADNASFATFVHVSNDSLREVAQEIQQAARRVALVDTLEAQLKRIAFVDGRDEFLNKATLASERILNGFIADLGLSMLPEKDRVMVETETESRHAFRTKPITYNALGIGPEAAPFAIHYVDDWICAFDQTVQDNAKGDSFDIDPALNAKLGTILQILSN